jgi:membrane protein involved in colicin uptake
VLRAPLPEATIKRSPLFVILFLLLTPVAAQEAGQYLECTANERDAYKQLLQRKLTANWRVSSQYRNVACTVTIAQNFRGEVLNAAVEDCADDPVLKKSAEDAAYSSSPLPTPENRACFERQIRVRLLHKPG